MKLNVVTQLSVIRLQVLGKLNNKVCEKLMVREGCGIQIRQMVPCG